MTKIYPRVLDFSNVQIVHKFARSLTHKSDFKDTPILE